MDALELFESDPEPAGHPGSRPHGTDRHGSPHHRHNFVGHLGGNQTGPLVPADLLGHDAHHGTARQPTPTLRQVARAGLAGMARPRPAGVMVFGVGLLILLLLGYIYGFTRLSEQRTQHQLLQSITAEPAATFDLTEGVIPPQGRPVAVLEIPALHLVDAVVQGSDANDLRSGPGHMPSTPLPGQPGNAVIAGRRATYGAPFAALRSLRPGDTVDAVDGYGQFHYRVTRILNVAVGRRDVVAPTSANRLTLVTAASGFLPSGRLAVVADLVGSPAAGSGRPWFDPVPAQLGLQGDGVSALLAVAWGVLFLLLLALTAWLLRRWSQPVVVYLLAMPVLLAVALFACESVAGALPATV